jgi:hypothetical protein
MLNDDLVTIRLSSSSEEINSEKQKQKRSCFHEIRNNIFNIYIKCIAMSA